jgi:acetyl-CoA carboxylase biotin carboxyl carrier protein
MSEAESPVDDVFDLERIRRLIELMKEHDLTELDLRQEEQQIRLCRGLSGPLAAVPMPALAPSPATLSVPASPGVAAASEESKIVFIRSPMVGTYYSRSNPNAEPLVKVGDLVDENTTVCIVEAMKVFNEIPAEVRGRVVAILAEDDEPVDFGRPLFKVDTSK